MTCDIALVGMLACMPACAQVGQFDIQSEKASKSIPELARQAGVQILAPGEPLQSVITPEVKGTYDVVAALEMMLKGTDLTVSRTAEGVIAISSKKKNNCDDRGETMSRNPKNTVSVIALLFGAMSAPVCLAQETPSSATDATPMETVVVTGSRVISNAASSPTPLTEVSTEELKLTTPTTIPDGLNKLPVFSGSTTQRQAGGVQRNATGNVLNLRNFGVARTLVLLDGHRVAPSNVDGTVDIDTLPQMLVSQIDIVTGGASAVYGSDAVTGVVNFVLDKNFNGVKADVSAGIAGLGIGANYQVNVAAGSDILDGRGHVEASIRHYHQDEVKMFDLPYGPELWAQTGTGTSAASPITSIRDGRQANISFTGYIANCGAGCTAANQQFVAPGVLGPFTPGTPSLTNGIQIGGDGGYGNHGTALGRLRTNEFFGRFSYDFDSKTSAYVNFSIAEANNKWTFANNGLIFNPNTFFKDNPYLTAATQAALNTGTGNTFVLRETFGDAPGYYAVAVNRNINMTAGVQGELMGSYHWDLYYTHGENRLSVPLHNNMDSQKLLASMDAVTNSSGQIVCYDTTAAAGAAANAAYAGCIPMNPFGPNTLSEGAFQYITTTTTWHQTNVLDDVGATISGEIFNLPAGPVKAALSGEWRNLSAVITSNGSPSERADCTGLRLCVPGTSRYVGTTMAPMPTQSMDVLEFAGEVDIPILKDIPWVRKLSVNLAGRYTDYSTSGSVETWKIGLDYHLGSSLRFRGTTSVDIRAPTLNDLYGPVQTSLSGFTDIHTNPPNGYSSTVMFQQSGGNPDLVPEVARTYTAGFVLTPRSIPNLTFSVDYYQINMKNAISTVTGNSVIVQNLCEASNGTSPYCALFVRPLPFSDHTVNNFPTLVRSMSLNGAATKVSGTDFEANYRFNLDDLIDGAPGSIMLRELVSWQPVNESQTLPGQPFTQGPLPGLSGAPTTGSKTRSTTFLTYSVGSWSFVLQNSWFSAWKKQSNNQTIYFTTPNVGEYNVVDLGVTKTFTLDNSTIDVYLTVQNVTNRYGPVYPTNSQNPGFAYPVPPNYPVLGRFFTLGVRGDL